MKKILKKEVIIAFIIGIILASSIAVYAATINAKDVDYKDGKTVEYALNELYRIGTENKKQNSGTFSSVVGVNEINIGFVPSKIVFTKGNGVTCCYNSEISNSNTYTCNSTGVHTYSLNSDSTDANAKILSVGVTTKLYASSANESWYWFAIE